jgi:hypothetical protein
MSPSNPSEISFEIELPVKISDALLASGVMKLQVDIAGSGDGGEVEALKFLSSDGSMIDEAIVISILENVGSKKGGRLISGRRVLEGALYEGALTGPCSFDNDGGELRMSVSNLDGLWVVSTFEYTQWEPWGDDLDENAVEDQ